MFKIWLGDQADTPKWLNEKSRHSSVTWCGLGRTAATSLGNEQTRRRQQAAQSRKLSGWICCSVFLQLWACFKVGGQVKCKLSKQKEALGLFCLPDGQIWFIILGTNSSWTSASDGSEDTAKSSDLGCRWPASPRQIFLEPYIAQFRASCITSGLWLSPP